MQILSEEISTPDDFLKVLQRFQHDKEDELDMRIMVEIQNRLGIWKEPKYFNYIKALLALPLNPNVMVQMIPPLADLPSQEHREAVRSYFLKIQRFDLCVEYLLIEPHTAQSNSRRVATELALLDPFLSGLLTGLLNQEALQYFTNYVVSNHRDITDLLQYPRPISIYVEGLCRSIKRDNKFAYQMLAKILTTNQMDDSDLQRIWIALCSHESIRKYSTAHRCKDDHEYAKAYYQAFQGFPDHLYFTEDHANPIHPDLLQSVIRFAPEKLLRKPESLVEERRSDSIEKILSDFINDHPKIIQELLTKDRKYIKRIFPNGETQLTGWQIFLVNLTLILSIITGGLFCCLLWGLVRLVTLNRHSIPLNPMDYFQETRKIDTSTISASIKHGGEYAQQFLMDCFLVAGKQDLPLNSTWDRLVGEYVSKIREKVQRFHEIFTMHRVEEACLLMEKNGIFPDNFNQLIAELETQLFSPYRGHGGEELGYLGRWLRQIHARHPSLQKPLSAAEEKIFQILQGTNDRELNKKFGRDSFLPATTIANHPSLALWIPQDSYVETAESVSRIAVLQEIDRTTSVEENLALAVFAEAIAPPELRKPIRLRRDIQAEKESVQVNKPPQVKQNALPFFRRKQHELLVNALQVVVEQSNCNKT